MQGDAFPYFLKEIFPLLAVPAVICFVLLWFPWKRLVWLPADASKVREEALRYLVSGKPEAAAALFQKNYGVPPEYARAIVESFPQKAPNQPLQPTTPSRRG
jgi:hypothetical protein